MTTRTTRRAVESGDELLRFEEDTTEFSVEFDDTSIVDKDDVLVSQPLASPMSSDYEERLQLAQEQLQALRQQQEAIERQKQDLEDLNEKQRSFVSGRSELSNKLSRSVAMLERESMEAQKRVEVFDSTREAFEQHIETLNSLKPENWDRAELRNELARALSLIEDSAEDFNKQSAKINSLRQTSTSVEPIRATSGSGHETKTTNVSAAFPTSFKQWFMLGLAFTLPLVIVGVLALLGGLFF